MQFQAAVLFETKSPLRIIERIEVPVLKPGQLLVKIHFAGICHSQLMEQSGQRGEDRYLPHMLGHEGTGTIVDCGPDTTKFSVGDKVILGWLQGSGRDAGGSVYQSPAGAINAGPVTTFGEYAVVSENRCYHLPEQISMREGVLLGCALPTGMGIVHNQMQTNASTNIGVMGLGGIGMSALIAATNLPHRNLIAIDTNDDKLKLARTLGATHCLNPDKEDLSTTVANITSEAMLDFAVEAAGHCRTIELAFSLLHPKHGLCVFASHPKHGDKITLDPHELICGKQIRGSWGGLSDPEQVVQQVAQNHSQYCLSALISDSFHLHQINNAMQQLAEQKTLRAIIQLSEDLHG